MSLVTRLPVPCLMSVPTTTSAANKKASATPERMTDAFVRVPVVVRSSDQAPLPGLIRRDYLYHPLRSAVKRPQRRRRLLHVEIGRAHV